NRPAIAALALFLRFGGVGLRLVGSRRQAQLLHQAEQVPVRPQFDDLILLDAVNTGAGDRRRSVRRRHAEEWSTMRAVAFPVQNHFVALRNGVFDSELEIGKPSLASLNMLPVRISSGSEGWENWIMVLAVAGH